MNYSQKPSILIVDDNHIKMLTIEAIMANMDLKIVKADSGKEALRHLLNQDFAVILLDINMPIMDGFETAELIRKRKKSEHTPIIFITSFNNTEVDIIRGYSLGAVDYILSPIVPEILRAKVGALVDLFVMNLKIKEQADKLVETEKKLKREIAIRKRAEKENKKLKE